MEYGRTDWYLHHVSNTSLIKVLNAMDQTSTLLITPRHHITTFLAIAINLKAKDGIPTCHDIQ
jgi:hypothetical protein